MKKILCFIDNLGSGGAQRQLVNLAVIFKKEGYEVSFLVYGKNNFYLSKLEENNIHVNYVKFKNNIERIFRVRKQIKKISPDIVISFLETPNFIACISKMLGGKWRLLTNELSSKTSTFLTKKNKIFNFFERYSHRKICNSQNACNLWKKYYPKYSNKYRVIYNPVMMPEEYQIEHTYLQNGVVHIVVAASYQELKGILNVIDAITLLTLEKRKKIIIDWYGRFEVTQGNTLIYDEAKKRVDERKLCDCIHLYNETHEIYKKMSEADVIGLFSTVEGLPNAICEGMTIGRPIIMTKVSDYSVLVEKNGVLCEPTVEGIRDGFNNLLLFDKTQFSDMGLISRKKAETLFSIDEIKKQWVLEIEGRDNETKKV